MPPVKKPSVGFGKAEKPELAKTIFLWAFIVIGIGAIALMIIKNPKQRSLTCAGSAYPSLNSFGTCSEN